MNETRNEREQRQREEWMAFQRQMGRLRSCKPVTGVIHNNTPSWLFEDDGLWIDLDYEEHLEECEQCQSGDGPCEWVDMGYERGTCLAGDWKQDPKTKEWEPDKTGKEGYSAIVREDVTQVVWSRWVLPGCRECSPCYPAQVDLDSTGGEYVGYCLPPDHFDKSQEEEKAIRERIVKVEDLGEEDE